MAHPEQQQWFSYVKQKHPEMFFDVEVLDIGSLDINGNNRWLFNQYTYIGVDVGEGKNVDVICKGHEYKSTFKFDVVISSECFEHDMHWRETLLNCVEQLRQGGLFTFSCATTGRQEHGTSRTTPHDSPLTLSLFNDYYMNLTEEDVRSVLNVEEIFSEFEFGTNNNTKDLYFYGIKK